MKIIFSQRQMFIFVRKMQDNRYDRFIVLSSDWLALNVAVGRVQRDSSLEGQSLRIPYLGLLLLILLVWVLFGKPLSGDVVGVTFGKSTPSHSKNPTPPRVRLQEGLGQDSEMKERIETLSDVLSKKVKAINGLVLRNGGRGLISLLLKAVRGIRPKATKSVVKQVARFVFRCFRIARHSGLKGLVLYLKASQVLLQQSVAGFRVGDLSDLKVRPKRNRSGLPTHFIPAGVRREIRRRNIPAIKLWMTLFGLFRILEFRGKLSFSTILDPGRVSSKTLTNWNKFLVEEFCPSLREVAGTPSFPKPGFFPVLKSSPTTSDTPYVNSSYWSLIRAARLWCSTQAYWRQLKVVSGALGLHHLSNRIRLVAMASHPVLDSSVWTDYNKLFPVGKGYLGKLGYKIEPAGKVRVFAMVDAWTQWLMAPIHGAIFNILKCLPTDGTFDQMRPIERLQNSLNRGRTFASIDLSAATDRLPISLQVKLLEVWLEGVVPDSKEFAYAWKDLLVGRHYSTGQAGNRKSDLFRQCEQPKTLLSEVKYAVGQPMGALSSWAMLALTHHAIVQWAAYRAGIKGWFQDYAILGDDIVIANGRVANEYRLILQEIGVKAGLAKSVMARGRFVVEFAKKFFVDDTRADMLPLKEVIATWTSSSLVLEFTRKYNLTLNSILALLGFGYKARSYAVTKMVWDLSNRLRVFVVWLSHPSSPIGKKTYVEWLTMKSWYEGHSPSDDTLREVFQIAEALSGAREGEIFSSMAAYEASAEKAVEVGNKHFNMSYVPVNFDGITDRSFERVTVSWSNVLAHSREIDLDEDPRYQSGIVAWGPLGAMKAREANIAGLDGEIKVGLPFDIFEVIGKWRREGRPEMGASPTGRRSRFRVLDPATRAKYGMEEIPIRDLLESRLKHLFSPDPISQLIPKEFWPESRESERKFRDFLMVFDRWVELSRPIWSEFYKTRPDLAAFGKKKAKVQVSKPVTALIPWVLRPLDLVRFRVGPWWVYQVLYASYARIGTSTINFMSNYALSSLIMAYIRDVVWTALWVAVITVGILSTLEVGETHEASLNDALQDWVRAPYGPHTFDSVLSGGQHSNGWTDTIWVMGGFLVVVGLMLIWSLDSGGVIPPESPVMGPGEHSQLIPLLLPEMVGIVPEPNLTRLALDTVNHSSEDLVSPLMAHGYWE